MKVWLTLIGVFGFGYACQDIFGERWGILPFGVYLALWEYQAHRDLHAKDRKDN